ncbi:MAG: 50S ribosomal protein L10 [Anaerolineales bacterium]|nr:50S ribosomal protein L10 [Anaerolineales bacterium]
MAITKERKQALVTQYKELAKDNAALILTTYSGLSVKELESLRQQIREVGGEFHIIKNKLADLAFKEANVTLPDDALAGPTAIGFAAEDVVGVAKAIVDLSKETEFMAVKGAVIDGAIFDGQQVRRMAELPPLPVVRAQFLSMLQAPANRFAAIMTSSVRQVVDVVKAYADSEATA